MPLVRGEQAQWVGDRSRGYLGKDYEVPEDEDICVFVRERKRIEETTGNTK